MPNSWRHTKGWESISPYQEAAPNRESPYPQVEVSDRRTRVHAANSGGHIEVWQSMSPIVGTTMKHAGPHPQHKVLHRSTEVHIPNSKGPQRSMGVHILSPRGHTEGWQSISPTPKATSKHGNTYPKQRFGVETSSWGYGLPC